MALRELLVDFVARFDFAGYEEANKKTEELKENLSDTGDAADKTGTKSKQLSGAVENLSDIFGAAGVNTGFFSRILAFMKHPIAIAIAAVAALVASFIALIGIIGQLTTSLVGFLTEMSSVGLQLNQTAQRIGVTVAQLQALRAAAGDTGVAITDMDSALTDLGQKIGEAVRDPASETAREFRRLGLSTAELRSMNAGQVFEEIADKIQNTQSSTERLRIANVLLGGAGRNLIPILSGGRAGLRRYEEQIRKLQPELELYTRNSLELERAQFALNLGIEGTKQILFNIFAPALTFVISKLAELVEWFNSSPRAVAALKTALITFALVVGSVVLILGLLSATMLTILAIVFAPFLAQLALMAAAFAFVTLAVDDFFTFLRGGESVLGEFVIGIFSLINGIQDMVAAWFNADGALGQFLDNLESGVQTVLESVNAFRRLAGLPDIELDLNLRRRAQEAVASTEDPGARALRQQGIISNFQQSPAQFLGLTGGGGAEGMINNSITKTSAANKNVQVSQNIQPNITINAAQNPEQIRTQIEEVINSANRDVVNAIG